MSIEISENELQIIGEDGGRLVIINNLNGCSGGLGFFVRDLQTKEDYGKFYYGDEADAIKNFVTQVDAEPETTKTLKSNKKTKIEVSKKKLVKMLKAHKKAIGQQGEMFKTLGELGIDMFKFENQFQKNFEDLFSYITNDKDGKVGTWLSWWLYEGVEKKIYIKDVEVYDVESAEDFVGYLLTCQ